MRKITYQELNTINSGFNFVDFLKHRVPNPLTGHNTLHPGKEEGFIDFLTRDAARRWEAGL